METETFVVPANKKSMIEEHLAKLNRRATKLGLDLIVWSWGAAFKETRRVLTQNPKFPESEPYFTDREVLVLPIELRGPVKIGFEGWRFIATLQHLETGENIIRSIERDVKIPTKYREVGTNCDHCHARRYRKDTYLLENEDTKVLCQVGSTCIKDFLGGHSPDDIIAKANFISELLSFMDNASDFNFGGGGGSHGVFAVLDFLTMTMACVREHGWVSRSKTQESGGTSTADRTLRSLYGMGDKYFVPSVPNEGDEVKAKAALEWVENISDDECENSDYLYNLRAIARSGMVEQRTAGFAASMAIAYDKELIKRSPKKVSQHVGKVKERRIFTLIYKRKVPYYGAFGNGDMYFFEDLDGNVMFWKTTNFEEFVVDQVYAVKGTIKEHGEYNGIKQTALSRCSVVKE